MESQHIQSGTLAQVRSYKIFSDYYQIMQKYIGLVLVVLNRIYHQKVPSTYKQTDACWTPTDNLWANSHTIYQQMSTESDDNESYETP